LPRDILNKSAISSKELELLLNLRGEGKIDFILIDIREPFEYKRGYIDGVDEFRATSKFESWKDEIIELTQRTPVILTCRTSNRSSHLQYILKQNGAKKLIDHKGGIVSWRGKIKKDS
jgi:rhodanese-related sulfurtransferase